MGRALERMAAAIVAAAALAGCTTAADAYFEQGRAWEGRDPSAAAEYYRLCLTADATHPLARERLQSADFYGALVGDAQRFEEQGQHTWALRCYDRMTEIALALRPVGGPEPPFDLVRKRDEAYHNAAAQRFQDGQRAQGQGDDAGATRAFRECLALDPAHPEARAAYSVAHERAVRRVAVLPFEAEAGADAAMGRSLADAVLSQLNARRPELVELVTRANLEQVLIEHDLSSTTIIDPATAAQSGRILGLDVLVIGRLAPLERSDTGWSEQPGQNQVERRVGTPPAPQVFTASWIVRSRTTRAALVLNLQAIDVETGAVLVAERVAREQTDTARFARKTAGDDSALPQEVAALCRRPDAPPAAPDDLVGRLVDPAAEAAAATLLQRLQ